MKYRNVNNNFQEKLKSHISKIKSSTIMFIFADKTNNIYEMKSQDHEKLIMENVTKRCKKKQSIWKLKTLPSHEN